MQNHDQSPENHPGQDSPSPAPITPSSQGPSSQGHGTHSTPTAGPVLVGIGLVIAIWGVATLLGLTVPTSHGHGDGHGDGQGEQSHAGKDHGDHDHGDHDHGDHDHGDHDHGDHDHGDHDHGDSSTASPSQQREHPHYLAVAPFVLLLGAIAVLPLIPATEHWWESNLNRFFVAAALGLVTILYYINVYSVDKVLHVLDHAIMVEYIPFIVLLFSLYTISGGIRISGDLAAHPLTNTAFIAIGGLLASFIGTTGAAMLLIRPLLETNKERKHKQHTVVFFIFVVCNCGGCLLPIGDPPLFLGYLMGVDFLWTMWNLWLPWLVVNIILLAIYWAWDHFFCYPHETIRDIARDETQFKPLRITGLWPNVLLLLGVIFAVALLDPSKTFPGTDWHPFLYLREVVQLSMVALSLGLGSHAIRISNQFNYHAIVEVAALFIGIFICMQPAIEILNVKGNELGVNSPNKAFWATGSLSSVLDNAPTYVVFFKTAAAQFDPFFPDAKPPVEGDQFATMVSRAGENAQPLKHSGEKIPAELVRERNNKAQMMLIGISLGAVFMGAMTYIGNGPNFMVRAIAEQSGVKMPSFFGYVIMYSAPVLLPVFLLATILFLWGLPMPW